MVYRKVKKSDTQNEGQAAKQQTQNKPVQQSNVPKQPAQPSLKKAQSATVNSTNRFGAMQDNSDDE